MREEKIEEKKVSIGQLRNLFFVDIFFTWSFPGFSLHEEKINKK
jgi:hypothetical protein